MQNNRFKFAIFVNRISGDEFVKRLLASGLTPEAIITYDPFYFPDRNPFIRFAKKLKYRIAYVLNKTEYHKNYLSYFLSKTNNIPVISSQTLHTKTFENKLRSLDLDYIFVFTFSLLKEHIFTIPRRGTINFHPAYLPKHRGASPLFWTILNGEKSAGITFHYIDKNIDSGKIIEQYRIPLSELEDSSILSDYINKIGAKKFVRLIIKLKNGYNPKIQEQEEKEASYEKPASCHERAITKSMTLHEITKLVNASAAYGNASFKLNGTTYKIIDCFELPENATIQTTTAMNGLIYLKTIDNKNCCLIYQQNTKV